ncbi:MAG: CBS domain-containing protein [Acidobacteriota bacterium]
MNARDVMTPNPASCTRDTSLREVARMLVEHDCGAIPVVDGAASRLPVGIVTDRDIACRAVAAGKNALQLTAGDCMSTPCISVRLDASLDDCCDAMEANKVRRVLVVDRTGACCGIVAQADVALRGKPKKAAELVREVSQPMASASAVTF